MRQLSKRIVVAILLVTAILLRMLPEEGAHDVIDGNVSLNLSVKCESRNFSLGPYQHWKCSSKTADCHNNSTIRVYEYKIRRVYEHTVIQV